MIFSAYCHDALSLYLWLKLGGFAISADFHHHRYTLMKNGCVARLERPDFCSKNAPAMIKALLFWGVAPSIAYSPYTNGRLIPMFHGYV